MEQTETRSSGLRVNIKFIVIPNIVNIYIKLNCITVKHLNTGQSRSP